MSEKYITEEWKRISIDGKPNIVIDEVKWNCPPPQVKENTHAKTHFIAKNRVILVVEGHIYLLYFNNRRLMGELIE